jgi:uncharacterized protein YdhG (YjbR/CyaY superfamily)
MKKAAQVGRSKRKEAVPKTFAAYLATVPRPARKTLQRMRRVIQSAVPRRATETISYRIPAFRDETGVLLWFAAFSDHCSLFPTSSVIEKFEKELTGFSTSKGTVHFPLDKPLPVGLITNLVKARVAQNEGKNRH